MTPNGEDVGSKIQKWIISYIVMAPCRDESLILNSNDSAHLIVRWY